MERMNHLKRVMAWVMTAAMLVSSCPTTAIADEVVSQVQKPVAQTLRSGETYGSLKEAYEAEFETTTDETKPQTPLPPKILELLGDADREQWTPLLTAAAIEERPIGELSARREEFRTLDRNRYTLFLLDTPKGTLTPVRTSVRIREPLAALLLWDETGSAVVYYSEAYA